MKFAELLSQVDAMYADMASRLTGTLVCQRCFLEYECDTAKAVHYLKHGWPTCCGETMRFGKPVEIEVPV